MTEIAPLPALPSQPAATPWPTLQWPEGGLPSQVDGPALEGLVATAFAAPDTEPLGETHAELVDQGGRIGLDRHGEGYGQIGSGHV